MTNTNSNIDLTRATDVRINVILITNSGLTTTFQTESWTKFAEQLLAMLDSRQQVGTHIDKILYSTGCNLIEVNEDDFRRHIADGNIEDADRARIKKYDTEMGERFAAFRASESNK